MKLQRCIALWLALSVEVFAGETQHPISDHGIQMSDDCHNACTELVTVMGGMTSYNFIPDDFLESFYCTRQSDVIPACVIRPLTPQDVSVAIKTISKHNCHFAIKSGGHGMFAGASNADGGITIDLKHLNGLELSEDLSTARVGTANRWGTVYEVLEPLGLVVVGGRVSHVGVGGFLLGGGISFLSRKYGWASDNVRNYEIVLANGSIANINLESHPDLYWALRGGGSNFGIVTRFDLEVYELGPVWGGNSVYALSDTRARYASLNIQRPFTASLKYLIQAAGRLGNRLACLLGRCTTALALIQAFEELTLKEKDADPYLQCYLAFTSFPKLDILAGAILHVHSEPVANPPAFKVFDNLGPPIYNSAKVRNLTDIIKELDYYNEHGIRMIHHELTLRFNATVFSQIWDFFIEEMEKISHVVGLFPNIVIQPLSQISSVGNHKNGGNPFGFTEDDGPIAAFLACPQWRNAEDDEAVNAAIDRFMVRTLSLAKETRIYHPWIYPNYANKGQEVYTGFGEENRKRLKQIQKKYDPEGIFERLQPGIFKV